MATRLYPITEDAEKLEKLCRVPAGTAALHAALTKEWDAKKPAEYDSKYDSDRYDAFCKGDVSIAQYDNFLIFGWGRMVLHRGSFGHTTDVAEVTEILAAQHVYGVDFNDCEGLSWS
jgi:hypothetical protein